MKNIVVPTVAVHGMYFKLFDRIRISAGWDSDIDGIRIMTKLKRRYFVLVVALGLGAIGLGGCGVRGGLESPPEDVAANRADTSKAGEEKPHKPFILDGLIR